MSVFSRVRRLFRSEGFPDEDFLTEIVFGFIERQPKVFVRWLRSIGATDFPVTSELSAATQYHSAESLEERLPAKRPDMLIWLRDRNQEQVLFIESKVASQLSGEDQLQSYARILWKLPTNASKSLVFVTRDYLPQDRTHLFAGIPEPQRPRFAQARWHELAAFLSKEIDLSRDTLTAELLDYMKDRQLDLPNTFTPSDIAALSSFTHSLSVMRAVLDGPLEQRFRELCGPTADAYDRDVKVAKFGMFVIQVKPSQRKNTNVSLGFWFGGDGTEYPTLYGDISFAGKVPDKAAVVNAFHKFASESDGEWAEDNVAVTSDYGRVFHEASIGQFLGAEDHVAAMRQYLMKVIEDVGRFRAAHPDLV
jgi:hypothetical protein